MSQLRMDEMHMELLGRCIFGRNNDNENVSQLCIDLVYMSASRDVVSKFVGHFWIFIVTFSISTSGRSNAQINYKQTK